jgi:hypothetical protein
LAAGPVIGFAASGDRRVTTVRREAPMKKLMHLTQAALLSCLGGFAMIGLSFGPAQAADTDDCLQGS